MFKRFWNWIRGYGRLFKVHCKLDILMTTANANTQLITNLEGYVAKLSKLYQETHDAVTVLNNNIVALERRMVEIGVVAGNLQSKSKTKKQKDIMVEMMINLDNRMTLIASEVAELKGVDSERATWTAYEGNSTQLDHLLD